MKYHVALSTLLKNVKSDEYSIESLYKVLNKKAYRNKQFLVKPNLFTNITSEKGATTDSKLILSVAEALKAQGATTILGECSAMASYTRRARDDMPVIQL